jgi:large repetitive protein
VKWTTTNAGTSPALPGGTETVALVQGAQSTIIGKIRQVQALAAGASLARAITYATPVSLSGDFTILVTVDSGDELAEATPTKTDNTASAPIAKSLAPHADLAVSGVTAPATTIADPAKVLVGWTFANVGNGAGVIGDWTDRVILSMSGQLGTGDNIVLGSHAHSGGLAAGRSYTQSQTISLPPGFSGSYTLFVVTNAEGIVFENGTVANNAAQLATPFDVIPYADAKKIVTEVVAARGASSGQIATQLVSDQPGHLYKRRFRVGRQRLSQSDG